MKRETKHDWVQQCLWRGLSYGVAIGGLYWAFHDIPVGEVVDSIKQVNWWWLLPAIALDLLVYVCAAWEGSCC